LSSIATLPDLAPPPNPLARIARGIGAAVRARPGVFAAVALAMLVLYIVLPPALLSLVRKPADYITWNPWLAELPHYLARADIDIQRKVEFIPNLALFWVSADGVYGEVDWGFAVTVADLARFAVLAVLFGVYFALVVHARDLARRGAGGAIGGRVGGTSGALASVLGFSTGGCTVMGCGAPVIPVVGLAFAGLSSGALAIFAMVSKIATVLVIAAVLVGVAWLGWRAGGAVSAGMRAGDARGTR
jgi:hypothetical protein